MAAKLSNASGTIARAIDPSHGDSVNGRTVDGDENGVGTEGKER